MDYHEHDYDVILRNKRGLISDLVGDGKELMGAAGSIKDFVFNLAGPIFKSLNKDKNIHAIKGLTQRLIPQTGFGSHHRGGQIRNLVQSGDIQQALDTMQRHRVKFDVKGLWAKQDSDISEVYKQCRKTLPHVDTLLTERLKGQTAVTTSLIQALFSEIKATLKVDMNDASVQLQELGEKTNLLETLLLDIVTEHFTERIAMYAVCGAHYLCAV